MNMRLRSGFLHFDAVCPHFTSDLKLMGLSPQDHLILSELFQKGHMSYRQTKNFQFGVASTEALAREHPAYPDCTTVPQQRVLGNHENLSELCRSRSPVPNSLPFSQGFETSSHVLQHVCHFVGSEMCLHFYFSSREWHIAAG